MHEQGPEAYIPGKDPLVAEIMYQEASAAGGNGDPSAAGPGETANPTAGAAEPDLSDVVDAEIVDE